MSSIDPRPVPARPSATSLESLTPSMQEGLTDLSVDCLEGYILLHQGNNKPGELASLSQGSLLSQDKVHGISIARAGSDGDRSECFISGLVEAHYKKVFYPIRLHLSAHGEIKYSSCECPAGTGPNATCKHIVAGMLLLYCTVPLYHHCK